MRPSALTFALAVSLALAGCPSRDQGRDAPAQAAAEPAAPAADAAAPPAAASEAPPRDALPSAEVQALLDRWLAAQNGGDFEAYEALYAARFEGVKRAGPRVYRFDRAGWLRDRRRMFGRPMRVEASEVTISATATSAVVTFRQRWSSERFSDEGPKQLVVVLEGDSLRIAREEMLASVVLASGPSAAPTAESFLFVVAVDGPAVVLDTSPEAGWGRGPFALVSQGSPVVVSQEADPGRLPEELRGFVGREVQLYGAEGPSCRATVRRLRVVRRVYPHFGVRQAWSGEEGGRPSAPAQIARDAWDLGAEGALLVGLLDAGSGACGGLWARPSGGREPVLYAPSEATLAEALGPFRGLSAYREVQADFDAFRAETGGAPGTPWHTYEPAAAFVTRWRDAAGGRSYLSVTVSAGSFCGDFGAELWALFEESPGRVAPRTDPRRPGSYRPVAVFDLEGDGVVEVLTDSALLRASGGGYVEALSIRPPDLDCGC